MSKAQQERDRQNEAAAYAEQQRLIQQRAFDASPEGQRQAQQRITMPSTSHGVGNLTERDASEMHDRYSGAGALAAYRGARSAETNSIIGSAMQQAQGLNAQENASIRSNAFGSINAQNQANLRGLAGQQAASGVRGGLAMAQMGQQRGAATDALATSERNLVADNIKYKQSGLQNAASIVGNQENIERDMGADKLGTVLAARAENAGLTAAQMQAQAAAASGGGGRGKK